MEKYNSGKVSKLLGEKMKINECAAAFDFSANRCDTCTLSQVDVRSPEEEWQKLPGMFSSQFLQPKRAHCFSMDSGVSQGQLLLLWFPCFKRLSQSASAEVPGL